MGLLLMLTSIGGTALAAVLLVVAWLNNSAWLKNFVLGGLAIWFSLYGIALVSTSLMSEERTLGLNGSKEFCGFYLDCHLHAAVSGSRRVKQVGTATAKGEFYVVRVKVSSDARRAELGLLAVDAHVVDAGGAEYTRDEMAEDQLPPQPEFETTIGPGGSFEKEIVFDLPADVDRPRLDIREGVWADRLIETFLIGDEDSLFHNRSYFNISEQNAANGVK